MWMSLSMGTSWLLVVGAGAIITPHLIARLVVASIAAKCQHLRMAGTRCQFVDHQQTAKPPLHQSRELV